MTADPADGGRAGAPERVDIAPGLFLLFDLWDEAGIGRQDRALLMREAEPHAELVASLTVAEAQALAPAAAAGVPDELPGLRRALKILRHPNAGMEEPDGGDPSQTDRVRNVAEEVEELIARLAASPAAPAGAKDNSWHSDVTAEGVAEIQARADAKGHGTYRVIEGPTSPGADLGAVEALIQNTLDAAANAEQARLQPTGRHDYTPKRKAAEKARNDAHDKALDAVRALALPSAGAAETIHSSTVMGLLHTIETRIIGVRPEDQDIELEDADWRVILSALKRDLDERYGTAALEPGTGAGAVSAELRALSEACRHDVDLGSWMPPYSEFGPAPNPPASGGTLLIVSGPSPETTYMRAALRFVHGLLDRSRIAAEGRARPAGGEEA